jgi:hypothetical protein
MKKISLLEYDKLPVIIQDDVLLPINALQIGDLYKMIENDKYIDKGNMVSIYKVINKKQNKIESISEEYIII